MDLRGFYRAFLLISFLFSTQINARDITPKVHLVRATDLIKRGIELYDSSKYQQAADLFAQVNRNDSAYPQALYELALTLEALEKYDSVLNIISEGFLYPGDHSNLLVLMGNAYDKKGNSEWALKTYESGINLYPYNYLMHFNKGVTLLRMKKYPEAEQAFIMSSTLNPYHITSIYNLGLTNESMGRTTEALLCYYTCGILNPNYMRNLEQLEDLLNNKSGIEGKAADYPYRPEEKCRNFEDIATYIKSNIILSSRFKAKVDINNIVIKQGQILLENLKYDKSVKTYYMQFMARFLTGMVNQEFTEALLYHLFSGVQTDIIQKKVAKEEKSIKKMSVKAVELLNEIRSTHAVDYAPGEPQMVYEYSGNNLDYFGLYTDETRKVKTGIWTSVFNNGHVEAKINFIDNKRQGRVGVSDENGNMIKNMTFVDDVDNGLVDTYHSNGMEKQEYTTYLGLAGGKYKEYYNGGQLFQEGQLINNEFDGLFTGYYPDKSLRFTKHYVANKENGNSKLYFLNGKLQFDINYINDVLDGPYAEYFENAVLKTKGQYKEGRMAGLWTTNHSNGKLESLISYNNNGRLTGKSMNYRVSGGLDNMFVMDETGNGSGQRLFFDKDTSLISKYFLKDMQMVKYEYYDKKGNILSAGNQEKGTLVLNAVYSDNLKRSEGTEISGEAEGVWKYYNPVGFMSSEKTFVNGFADGAERFYYPDGSLKSVVNYKNDVPDGYYVSYHPNGKESYLGWYKNESKQGEWHSYYPDGTLKVKNWFLNDQLDGYQEYYSPNGKLDYEERYRDGLIEFLIFYDTNGKRMEMCEPKYGNGTILSHYPGGKLKSAMSYLNGALSDTLFQYYITGWLKTKTLYRSGKIDGVYKEFYPSGTIARESNYMLGKMQGKVRSYEEDGMLSYEADYLEDNCNGVAKWYNEDGVETIAQFEDDTRNGASTYYSRDGSIICVLNYVDDVVKSVTYLGLDGKVLDPLLVTKGECAVKTYF